MKTPLLMAFGDKDGSVDWHQGIEMYNLARRAGKQFVLLVYPGENHALAKKPNQVDYQRRILEWFAHYLQGETAPDWITRGIGHLEAEKARKSAR
jgi:dipeptidyl aminopeptidase/acylaminoacyl peptidase